MTDADLARWEAEDNASTPPGMHEELQALIAEVRRLRADLTAIIGMHSCGDECAEQMIERAQIALGDDGTLRWGCPQVASDPPMTMETIRDMWEYRTTP